ncbi:hypothetical protein BDN72DRAFT_867525 [Pluteus cervinus]|uniref:Uncharacterized protein n=1 Tax=Pluteus cervinus TaxID=181527 RepID=A0ACD3BCL6_9AGAR|nr:hypothetical protein BDN72DRAFT_867525 [Pluteus cervinus]
MAQVPVVIPPLTTEEEDNIILARITNDERPLRRVLKKFHNYTSLSHSPPVPLVSSGHELVSVEDAREAFLVELASFQLALKKSAMICEAEARQVEEYQRERQRIDEEHGKLRIQIEQLKTALEFAQMERRRKIEYDLVAEKVNIFPTREELEISIQALENDMAAIRAEHDTQSRTIQGQKAALDTIISDLGSLRFFGKDRDTVSTAASPSATPAAEESNTDGVDGYVLAAMNVDEQGTFKEEEGEDDDGKVVSGEGTLESIEDDIEMGEVEEEPNTKGKKKVREEELEEGEASDGSSELSEPPDD